LLPVLMNHIAYSSGGFTMLFFRWIQIVSCSGRLTLLPVLWIQIAYCPGAFILLPAPANPQCFLLHCIHIASYSKSILFCYWEKNSDMNPKVHRNHVLCCSGSHGDGEDLGGHKEMSSIWADRPIAPSNMSPNAGGGGELRGPSQ
jgi:hypothetical protein